THHVRVHPSSDDLPRQDQLAWKLAELATDPAPVPTDVADMVINRVIDNTAVATASLLRQPVVAARAQALDHPYSPGATLYGRSRDLRVSPDCAACANGVAVREHDFHDTFLAADYSHPGDNIPPLLAVAQHTGATGADLVRAIATAFYAPRGCWTGTVRSLPGRPGAGSSYCWGWGCSRRGGNWGSRGCRWPTTRRRTPMRPNH